MASKGKSDDKPVQPHFGAFITMMAGLLLFFGLVSRIGKVDPQTGDLSAAQQVDPREETNEKIRDARERVVQDIGDPRATLADGSASQALEELEHQLDGLFDEPEVPQIPDRHEQTTPERETPERRPARQRERYYTVQPGDSLARIARTMLGSARRWREIQQTNPQLKDRRLEVGEKLLLPETATPRAEAPLERDGVYR